MRRRDFLAMLTAIPLPRAAQAAARGAPRNLKITDVKVLVTNPNQAAMGNFVLVKIVTSEAGLEG